MSHVSKRKWGRLRYSPAALEHHKHLQIPRNTAGTLVSAEARSSRRRHVGSLRAGKEFFLRNVSKFVTSSLYELLDYLPVHLKPPASSVVGLGAAVNSK